MMSLLTPIKSEDYHAKMSLFLSRKGNNFASSLGESPFSRKIVLFGTLGSSATLFVSQSTSIADLTSFGAFVSIEQE
jgi:hypothetical protein